MKFLGWNINLPNLINTHFQNDEESISIYFDFFKKTSKFLKQKLKHIWSEIIKVNSAGKLFFLKKKLYNSLV